MSPTEGELNRIIDSLLHPLFRKSKVFVIIDGLAHAIVERNPKKSAKKFIRYNLKELLK
jgi:hypothetical protein